jgi:hypothetical protein
VIKGGHAAGTIPLPPGPSFPSLPREALSPSPGPRARSAASQRTAATIGTQRSMGARASPTPYDRDQRTGLAAERAKTLNHSRYAAGSQARAAGR